MKYLVGKSPELDNEKSTEELDPDIIKPIGQLGWFNQPCTKEQRDNNEHGECEKVRLVSSEFPFDLCVAKHRCGYSDGYDDVGQR